MLAVALQSLADDPLPQDQPSPTVRGLAFGATLDALKTTLKPPWGSCFGGKRDQSCRFNSAIGTVGTTDTYVFDERGGLRSVYMEFQTSDYAVMREAFVAKFGKPSEASTSVYKNAYGASFEFETATWKGATMAVILSQYSRSASSSGTQTGIASFMTRTSYDELAAAMEASRKKAPKDF
jgi:hypothetical protein